jgi:hypothetical protein
VERTRRVSRLLGHCLWAEEVVERGCPVVMSTFSDAAMGSSRFSCQIGSKELVHGEPHLYGGSERLSYAGAKQPRTVS